MRDDLGERLREEAGRLAASVMPRPAHLVRARGDQRRRRAAVLSATVASAVLAVGGGGVYSATGHLGRAGGVTSANSFIPTPPPSRPGNPDAVILREVNSLTCVSAADCWVVGLTQSVNGTLSPLIGHWNGSGWSMKAVPVPPRARITTLTAVSCLGARD